uniref:Uncharacterized protein n=1 Tax=viral metagenome TaxID=1070528 RepID=A0A6C0F0F9_9ZZZZ
MYTDNGNGNNGNGNNISMANRVEQIYDVILGAGCIVFSILALSNLFIMTISKFVDYYSRQIDRIVMDESESECSESESEFSDDDDDSSESEYSEYSENESSHDDDDDDESDCHHHHHDDIELSPYIPPRRSERLAENRARCNSPLLVVRLKFE